MNAGSAKTEKTEPEAAEGVLVLPLPLLSKACGFSTSSTRTCSAYNMPAAIRIIGELNVKALEQSFSEIVRRHETLRTTFGNVDGQPMQFIAPTREVLLPVTDLRGLESVERAQQEHRLITEEA
jgi:hypothetical protein